MTPRRTYLDWNASAPLRPSAREAMLRALDLCGNPSSVHREGRDARRVVEDARDAVAGLLAAPPADVIFTSGATEANAFALAQGWRRVAFAAIEHDSVVLSAEASGAETIALPIDPDGRVMVGALAETLNRAVTAGPSLLSLQLANNETGVLQPVAEVAAIARTMGWQVHCDAVQAVGRMPVDFAALGVDYLAVSSHKLGGPKGAGALVVRSGAPNRPLIPGGGQERRRRSGTENVPAIAGFGAAARDAADDRDAWTEVVRLRDQIERVAVAAAPETRIVAGSAPRLANTTLLAHPGRSAETLVVALDLEGVAVSAGAACSSGKVGESRILTAMGIDRELRRGAIRISIGPTTTSEDVAAFASAWNRTVGAAVLAA